MNKPYLLIFLFFFISCSETQKPISLKMPIEDQKIPGRYAFIFDSEKWNLTRDYNFFRCKKRKFNININSLFNDHLSKNLNKIFDEIHFFDMKSNSNKLLEKKFDGQIILSKTNASAYFSYDGELSTFRITLNGNLKIITKKDNLKIIKSIKSSGQAVKENIINCNPKHVASAASEKALNSFFFIIFNNIYSQLKD